MEMALMLLCFVLGQLSLCAWQFRKKESPSNREEKEDAISPKEMQQYMNLLSFDGTEKGQMDIED